MKQGWWIGCLVVAIALAGCGGEDAGSTAPEGAGDAPAETDVDVSTPRGAIAHQVELLKSGDVEAFKACFTARLQDRITAEAMAQGAEEVGSMSLDDLFASATEGEVEGRKTAKVKMKNGRTLTTLIFTDGKWLADTIWFR